MNNMSSKYMSAQATASDAVVVPQPIVKGAANIMTRKSRNKRLGLIVSYVILIVAVLFAVYPVYFAFLVSIRPNGQLLSLNLSDMFLPSTGISFDSYNTVMFGKQPFFSWLGNSLVIALSTLPDHPPRFLDGYHQRHRLDGRSAKAEAFIE